MTERVPLESSITRRIRESLNKLPQTRCIKLHGGPMRAGEPDLLVVTRGRAVLLEVKRAGMGRLTELQKANLARWAAAGAAVAVVTSVQEALGVVAAALRGGAGADAGTDGAKGGGTPLG